MTAFDDRVSLPGRRQPKKVPRTSGNARTCRCRHSIAVVGLTLFGLSLLAFGAHANMRSFGDVDLLTVSQPQTRGEARSSVPSGTLFYLPLVFKDHFDAAALWTSLMRYERFVRTYEDSSTGYHVLPGYPQYLYCFGKMYLHLWQHTGEELYREKLVRCLGFVEHIRNDNWTWGSGSAQGCPLYNAHFTELFLDAWQALGDETYLTWARETVQAFSSPDVYDVSQQHFRGNYNMNFLPFASIAFFQTATGETYSEIRTLGSQAFEYALSGYDPLTGRWYYSEGEKAAGFFNGHSAYYELVQVSAFLKHREAVMSIYPDEGQSMLSHLPNMMAQVSTFVLPSGTFYYNNEAPDYTEGAAETLVGFGHYDQLFDADHGEFLYHAAATILSRQAPDGGYYKNAGSLSEDIWYSDEIGAFVPVYLQFVEGQDFQGLP